MKEATGKLNMTVVTLVAVAALAAMFYLVIWPIIQTSIVTQTCKSTFGSGWHAVRQDETLDTGAQTKTHEWQCCPAGVDEGDTCTDIDYGED